MRCYFTQRVANLRIRSHSDIRLNCQIKYSKYGKITLIMCWCSIHLATINFQLLSLAIWCEIWKGLKVIVYAVCWGFVNQVSPIHDSPILYLISTLNWFDYPSLKLQEKGYLYDDDTRQILVRTKKHIGKEVQERHQKRVFSYDSKYKIKPNELA